MMFESTIGIRLEARELYGADCTSAAILALLAGPQHVATSARIWSSEVIEDFVAGGGRCVAVFTDERTPKVGPVGVAFSRGGEIEQMVVSAIAAEGIVERVLIPEALRQVAGEAAPTVSLRVDAGENSARWGRVLRAAGFEDAGDGNWKIAPLKPAAAA